MWFCKIILLCLLLLRPVLSGGEFDEVDSHKTTYARDFSYINIRDSNRCSVEFELMSTTEIQSSAYSTPIVFPFHRDGKKQILINTIYKYTEMIEHDGTIHFGWPLGYDDSHYDISPIPFDCDNDGIDDLLLINYDGLIRCIDNQNHYIYEFDLNIPLFPLDSQLNDLLKTKHPYVYSNTIFFDNDQFVYLNTTERSFCQPLQIHLTRSAVLHNDIEDINLDHYEAHHSSTTPSSHFTDFYNEPSQSYYYEDAFTHTLFSFTEAIEEDNVYSFIKKYKFLVDEDEDLLYNIYTTITNFQNRNLQLDEKIIYMSPHVLASPAIYDVLLNDVIHTYMILPVSYYEQDPILYNVCALICYDLTLRKYVWLRILDITSSSDLNKAYIYDTPTIVNFFNSSQPDILVATSSGLVYLLTSTGELRPHWPIIVNEVQAQITVENLGNGMNIIFGDKEGIVYVYTPEATLVWKRNLYGPITQSIQVADVDQDGVLDLVVATTKGDVYALKGTNGNILKAFPIKIPSQIHAPITLINLNPEQSSISLIIPAYDNYLYVYNPQMTCIRRIYIDGYSTSQVLVADLSNSHHMDLILSTTKGFIYIYRVQPLLSSSSIFSLSSTDTSMPTATDSPLESFFLALKNLYSTVLHYTKQFFSFHKEQTRSEADLQFELMQLYSQNQGLNVFTYKPQTRGILFDLHQLSASGTSISVSFTIYDKAFTSDSYLVIIKTGSLILYSHTYTQPGHYSCDLTFPSSGSYNLLLSMYNQHYQYYYDILSLQYNSSLSVYFSYYVFIPFLVLYLYILFTRIFHSSYY